MIYESKRVAALSVGEAVDRRLEPEPPRPRGLLTGLGAMVAVLLSALLLVAASAVLAAALQGWRPVVIQTGSMEPTIPVGALVVARPQAAEELAVGQVLIMQPAGLSPVTHRITGIDRASGLITTRGDANPSDDPAPYAAGDEELIARFVVDNGGVVLVAAAHPLVPTALTTLAVLILLPALFRQTAAEVWRVLARQKKPDLAA